MSYGVYWVKNVQKKMRILNTLPKGGIYGNSKIRIYGKFVAH